MTEIQWAWVAGLFEGEGCISITKNRSQYGSTKYEYQAVQLIVNMTDLDVLEKLQKILGVGTLKKRTKEKEHHKESYKWTVSAMEDTKYVLKGMLPHLGKRRSAKALEALGSVEMRQSAARKPYGTCG